MAIDYAIQYDCVPRRELGDDTILELLKDQERAEMMIRMFRQNGDSRPPSEMGYEFTRTTPLGDEETELIVVQDVLDRVEELNVRAHHCRNCPANRRGQPYGCTGFIQYPLSGVGEAWLLNQLPNPQNALVWLLLKQGIDNFMYDGQDIADLRRKGDTYFEDRKSPVRKLGEFDVNSNQVFEMTFTVGDINPNHAGVLLLFFNAIDRDLEADAIMSIGQASYEQFPFQLNPEPNDDKTIMELKSFLNALYVAWALKVGLRVVP
jgi:hypothetical protein